MPETIEPKSSAGRWPERSAIDEDQTGSGSRNKVDRVLAPWGAVEGRACGSETRRPSVAIGGGLHDKLVAEERRPQRNQEVVE
jgi:hypothetical protein